MADPVKVLAGRIADFERRYPQHSASAVAVRRARDIDIDLDRIVRAERAADGWRRLACGFARIFGFQASAAWRQRRYRAQRAAQRRFYDVWLAGRIPLQPSETAR